MIRRVRLIDGTGGRLTAQTSDASQTATATAVIIFGRSDTIRDY